MVGPRQSLTSYPVRNSNFTKPRGHWKDDINFFRLGVLCGFVEYELGISYREDQRDVSEIRYTDPSDLFLNGVMETRRGTCGNMAALQVALAWRFGWPVSLACVNSHFICRYDDGVVTHNIEATQSGHGGFKSDPDAYLIKHHGLSPTAIQSGSDLRALTAREVLATFIGLRARHFHDVHQPLLAETDYLLARHLFPRSRALYRNQSSISITSSPMMFEPHEKGHPKDLAEWLNSFVGIKNWDGAYTSETHSENYHAQIIDALFEEFPARNAF